MVHKLCYSPKHTIHSPSRITRIIGKYIAGIVAIAIEFAYRLRVNVFQALDGVNWIVMLSSFVFFFIFGYLLYAALFAAIGAMVDQDSETQQFVIPATIPLMLSIFLLGYIVTNPSGNLAVWLSFIPFYFAYSYDGSIAIWCTILAYSNFGTYTYYYLYCNGLDFSKIIQNRNTYVWQKNEFQNYSFCYNIEIICETTFLYVFVSSVDTVFSNIHRRRVSWFTTSQINNDDVGGFYKFSPPAACIYKNNYRNCIHFNSKCDIRVKVLAMVPAAYEYI